MGVESANPPSQGLFLCQPAPILHLWATRSHLISTKSGVVERGLLGRTKDTPAPLLPGNHKGFRRSVPGTWDKGQIAYFLYITVSHRCREVVIPKVIRPDGGRPEFEPEFSDSRALSFPWNHSGLGSTAADGAHGPHLCFIKASPALCGGRILLDLT